jgi:hypothetical protein
MHFALEGLDGGKKDMRNGQGQEKKSKSGAGAKAGTGMQEDEEIEVDDTLSKREKGVEALMERVRATLTQHAHPRRVLYV